MSEDPVSQVARWRPRPEHVECRRASGEVETYQVTAGRRAWQRLRAMLPADVIELVGRKGPAIVGRWQAATTPIPTQDVELDDDDEGYDEDAPLSSDVGVGEPPDDSVNPRVEVDALLVVRVRITTGA